MAVRGVQCPTCCRVRMPEHTQELERRVEELEVENEHLKRVLHLHKQRCSILEEACLANEVHVPGGLLAHQHVWHVIPAVLQDRVHKLACAVRLCADEGCMPAQVLL